RECADPGLSLESPRLHKSGIRSSNAEIPGVEDVCDINTDRSLASEHLAFQSHIDTPLGFDLALRLNDRSSVVALNLNVDPFRNHDITQKRERPAEIFIAKPTFNVFSIDLRIKEITCQRSINIVGQLDLID